METYIVAGDFQSPYEDPQAVEVFLQIAEGLKPDALVINGDFVDWRVLAGHFPVRTEKIQLVATFRGEVHHQRELLRNIVKRVKAKQLYWTDGNHEWRLFRTLFAVPDVLKLLEVESIAKACTPQQILGLDDLGFHHAGEYPAGFWMHNGRNPNVDLWIEHGYQAKKKATYTAAALIDDRMSNVITNHTEKLGILWKRAVGNRHFFGAEAGNLSLIGEPGKGEGIYSTPPHTSPNVLNHQQGFLILFHDKGNWWPHPVPIFDGRAIYNGKLYKA